MTWEFPTFIYAAYVKYETKSAMGKNSYMGLRRVSVYTDGSKTLHTQLVKHYNDLLDR